MIFEWNESKRIENWERRKVDFAEAVAIFNDPALIESLDDRDDYGEERVQERGRVLSRRVHLAWRRASRHHGLEDSENGKKRYQALFARRNQRHEGEG
ncbi:MAG: BrnT family toxin [Rhodomicrobium sp.]